MDTKLYKDLYETEKKHWWHLAKRRLVVNSINEIKHKNNPKILDVGCGTGGNMLALQNLGNVYGVDNSKEAVSFCKKNGLKDVSFANSNKIPFSSKSFDIITMLDVLEHVDEESTIVEVKRLLKKNGRLVISVPAYSWMWSKWDDILHHKRRYTIKTLSKVLLNNNFEISKITYVYSFLLIPVFVVRLIKSRLNQKNYSSDFQINNVFINWVLAKLSIIESTWLRKHNIPFGLSVFAIAKNV